MLWDILFSVDFSFDVSSSIHSTRTVSSVYSSLLVDCVWLQRVGDEVLLARSACSVSSDKVLISVRSWHVNKDTDLWLLFTSYCWCQRIGRPECNRLTQQPPLGSGVIWVRIRKKDRSQRGDRVSVPGLGRASTTDLGAPRGALTASDNRRLYSTK